jgi:hypothetical protein
MSEILYRLMLKDTGEYGFPDEVYTVEEIADGDFLFQGCPYKDFKGRIVFCPIMEP